jgi:predicted S18 family serine protease
MAGKTTSMENIIYIVLLLFVLSVTVVPIVWRHFRSSDVLKSGVSASAKIVDVTDTGRRHNNNPVVSIRLIVTGTDGRDFNAEVTMPVSPVRLTRYQPGTVVAVKYDPKSPDRIAIDTQSESGSKPE